MTLEPPLGSVAAIMHEEHGQHLGARHHADELGMVAQLHVVVWCWRG